MKKPTLKLLCALISICLLTTLFSGCSSKNGTAGETASAAQEQSTSAAGDSQNTSAQGEPAKLDTSPITFKAIMHPQLAANKWGEDDVSKYITEKTGVTLDVTYQNDYDNKQLSTMLASGTPLPDFIVVSFAGSYNSPVDNILHNQGYVLPLNKLAEQYSPDFFKYLPKDMDKIYAAEDGNLYCVGDLYGDVSRTGDLEVSSYVDSGLAIQKAVLEKTGMPIDTLEDFKNACLKVKEQNPGMKNIIMNETAADATNYRDIVQIVNRIYGGQPVMSIAADDTVHLNFRDEAYVKALKYVGDLYRSKLFPAESFTMTSEQRKQALVNNDVFAYFGFYFNLGSQIPTSFTKDTPYWSVDLPAAPDVPRDQIKLFDSYAGVGGWHAVHISKDCKDPARAIQYITFMMSDEGQLLQRLGVKGKGYEDDPNGGYVFSQARKDLTRDDPPKLATQLGIDNWNWCWFESFHSVMIGEALNAKELPALQDYYDRYNKYARNERINTLTAAIHDNDMLVLRAKIDELWKNSQAKIVLAASENKLMEEYNKFLDQAEKLGLARLEAAYTENYKMWKEKIGN